MPKFKIAHIKEQGVDLIVVPLDGSFEHKSKEEQLKAVSGLQACATSAGLAGVVVPIWGAGNSFRFIAPQNWHAFFRIPGIYQRLLASRNKELTCD